MWDFLANSSHYLFPHKHADISWENKDQLSILDVNYNSKHNQTSAGFRGEVSLKPNTTYQLDIEAQLIKGDFAFIYVETGKSKTRLVPRFKVYQNTQQPYRLKHKFITSNDNNEISVFLGILFYHPDKDYHLKVNKFILQEVAKLTVNNLQVLENQYHKSLNSPVDQQSILLTNTVDNGYTINQTNLNNDTNNATKYTYASKLPVNPPRFDDSEQITVKDAMTNNQLLQTNPSFLNKSILNSSIFPINQSNNKQSNKIENKLVNRLTNQQKDNQTFEPSTWDTSTVYTSSSTKKHLVQSNVNLSNLIINPDDFTELQPKNASDWFPAVISRNLLFTFKEMLEKQHRKIHISITTTPKRLSKLSRVIDSFLNQSVPIYQIHIVIPTRHKRFNSPYLVDKKWYFKSNKKINIIRVPDIGPLNKLHSALDMVKRDDILLTADDDHTYPTHWAFFLSLFPMLYPKFSGVYAFKGFHQSKIINSKKQYVPTNIDCIVGELGVAYPRRLIKNQAQLLKQVGYSKDAFYSDDVLISNHLASCQIARILLPSIDEGLHDLVYPKKLQWANSHDSLHKMNPPQSIRYINVYHTLKTKNHYFLDYLGDPIVKNEHLTLAELTNQRQKEQDYDELMDSKLNPSGAPIDSLVLSNHNNNNNNNNNNNSIMTNIPPRVKMDKLNLFDPSIFAGVKVRYISYLNDVFHTEWMLLYLKKLPQASLEMPNLSSNVSLPQEYAQWIHQDVTNYDVLIIDIPFCRDTCFQIKTQKPIYYIYRFPELGFPNVIFDEAKKLAQRSKFKPKLNLLTNSEANYPLPEPHFVWRVLPELNIKNVNTILLPNIVHLVYIATEPYYHSNLEIFLDFWKNHCVDLPIQLHLGICQPLSQKVQKIINDQQIKNINLYTQSNIFGTLVHRCQYYINLGWYLDLYAVWAHQNGRAVIMMKYGEFKKYPKILPIPFTLGEISTCPELFVDHSNCDQQSCHVYGYKKIINVPVVNQLELKRILTQLQQNKVTTNKLTMKSK